MFRCDGDSYSTPQSLFVHWIELNSCLTLDGKFDAE